MDPRYSPFNISTALAIAFSFWIIRTRWRGSPESNLPLFYYLGTVVYSYVYPAVLPPPWIYAGSVAALFLRFEFMGGFVIKVVYLAESVVLWYFVFCFWSALVL